MERLFVYGTLAPGQANHAVMEGIPGHWEAATLRGRLKDEGWGAEMGCPGIIPCDDGEEVKGFILSSKELAGHWSRLDDFEGEGYSRMLVRVVNQKGEYLEAYVYTLTQAA